MKVIAIWLSKEHIPKFGTYVQNLALYTKFSYLSSLLSKSLCYELSVLWCVAVDFRLVDQHVDVALELQARRSNEAVVPSKRAVEAQKTPWGTL